MSTAAAQAHFATGLKRWLPWIGWVLSAASMSILLMSARWKLTSDPWYVQEWGRIGWETGALPRIALVQLTCVVLYLVPQTAVLGAVLLTGYLGGAISQYVRLGELYPPLVPLTTALLAWAGLYLREERLRSLLPFRRARPD
jgi:DoxX-like family